VDSGSRNRISDQATRGDTLESETLNRLNPENKGWKSWNPEKGKAEQCPPLIFSRRHARSVGGPREDKILERSRGAQRTMRSELPIRSAPRTLRKGGGGGSKSGLDFTCVNKKRYGRKQNYTGGTD